MEKCVGTVLPHLRGKGGRIILKKLVPGGRKRSPRGVKFRPLGHPKTADFTRGPVLNPWFVGPEASRGVLGGRCGLSGKWLLFFFERAKKYFWIVQGPSWTILGPFPGPGEAPGGHFWRFCCCILGAVFYIIFVLCCVPCCVLCGVAKIESM